MFFNKDYSVGKLLLTGCDVADVRNQTVIRGVDILLERGKIAAVGGFDSDSVDAEIIHAAGRTVTPGLIDAHVHLCLSAEPDCHLNLDTQTRDEKIKILCNNLLRNLCNGVTTVRDLGCRWDMLEHMRELEVTETVYPSVFASGPVCTVSEGHALFIGEAISPDTVDAFLRRLKNHGADTFKLVGTGGNLSPGTDCNATQYTDAQFAALVDAALAEGFDVSCHVHATAGIEQCLRFGVRSIEHGSYMERNQVERLSDSNSCYWVSTVCPGRLISVISDAAQDRVNRRRSNIRYAVEVGGKLVAGTDAGIGGVYHGCLAYELDEFTDAGKTPLDALRSATYLSAVMMRCEDKIGVIEAGACADVLLYDGDIAKSGFSFHNPLVVIKGGRIIKNEIDHQL